MTDRTIRLYIEGNYMCNSSADAIDAEIIDDLKHGKNVDSNGKYDGIVQSIVKTAKEIRLGANHEETLVV